METGAEICAIDGRVPAGFWVVDVLALCAEEFDGLEARVVAWSEGQERVAVAQDTRAAAEVVLLEFVDHLGQAAGRYDISRVHKAVEVSGRLFYRLAHVIFAVEVEDVGDQIQGVLVVVDFRVETRQVEAVGYVFFIDFAEVFVATRGDELGRLRC